MSRLSQDQLSIATLSVVLFLLHSLFVLSVEGQEKVQASPFIGATVVLGSSNIGSRAAGFAGMPRRTLYDMTGGRPITFLALAMSTAGTFSDVYQALTVLNARKPGRFMDRPCRKKRSASRADVFLTLRVASHRHYPLLKQVSAHRPLEVTRMAVHDACGREMADALRNYRAWVVRNHSHSSGGAGAGGGVRHRNNNNIPRARRSGGEYAPQDYPPSAVMAATVRAGTGKRMREDPSRERVAELQRTPVGWRTLRWLMMRRQDEERSQAAEAAAMLTEEMRQRYKEKRVNLVWLPHPPGMEETTSDVNAARKCCGLYLTNDFVFYTYA